MQCHPSPIHRATILNLHKKRLTKQNGYLKICVAPHSHTQCSSERFLCAVAAQGYTHTLANVHEAFLGVHTHKTSHTCVCLSNGQAKSCFDSHRLEIMRWHSTLHTQTHTHTAHRKAARWLDHIIHLLATTIYIGYRYTHSIASSLLLYGHSYDFGQTLYVVKTHIYIYLCWGDEECWIVCTYFEIKHTHTE